MKKAAIGLMVLLCAWLTAGPSLAQVSGGTPQGTTGVEHGTAPNGTGDFTSNDRTFSGNGVDGSSFSGPVENTPVQQTYTSPAPASLSPAAPVAPVALKPDITAPLQADNEWSALGIGFAVVFMLGALIAGCYAFLAALRHASRTLPPLGI